MTLDLSDPQVFCDDLTRLIHEEIERRGISASQFSTEIAGNDALLKNLRKGSIPSAPRLSKILAELGQTLTLGVEPPLLARDILKIDLPKGRTWTVPAEDPGDIFFFKPGGDFVDGGGAVLMDAMTWGVAERDAELAILQPIVVRRASDGGVNIGRIETLHGDGDISIETHGRAGPRIWRPDEISGIWRITWVGTTPPRFAIDASDSDANDNDLEFAHQKVVEVGDLLKEVLAGRTARRVEGKET